MLLPTVALADEKQMSNRPLSGLSPRTEKIIRRLSTVTVLGLAIAAAILSFSGLQELSIRAGISHSIAWLLPIVIDGMVLTGSLGVVASSLVGIGTWYPWTLTIIGVVASIAGNVSVASHNLSSRLVHATGPVTFALSIEGLLRIYRASAVANANRERDRLAKEEAAKSTSDEARSASRTHIVSPSSTSRSTVKAPASPVVLELDNGGAAPTKIERLKDLWLQQPNITGADAARTLGLDPSYARKILRELRDSEAATGSVEESGISKESRDAQHSLEVDNSSLKPSNFSENQGGQEIGLAQNQDESDS